MVIPYSDEPVYKYNPIEMRQELTRPDSKLRYNIYSREWVYVKWLFIYRCPDNMSAEEKPANA